MTATILLGGPNIYAGGIPSRLYEASRVHGQEQQIYLIEYLAVERCPSTVSNTSILSTMKPSGSLEPSTRKGMAKEHTSDLMIVSSQSLHDEEGICRIRSRVQCQDGENTQQDRSTLFEI